MCLNSNLKSVIDMGKIEMMEQGVGKVSYGLF